MEICFCLIFDFEILQIVTNCLYFLIEFGKTATECYLSTF